MEEDMFNIIAGLSDPNTIIAYCSSSKRARIQCAKKSFWYPIFERYGFNILNKNYNKVEDWVHLFVKKVNSKYYTEILLEYLVEYTYGNNHSDEENTTAIVDYNLLLIDNGIFNVHITSTGCYLSPLYEISMSDLLQIIINAGIKIDYIDSNILNSPALSIYLYSYYEIIDMSIVFKGPEERNEALILNGRLYSISPTIMYKILYSLFEFEP